MDWLDTETKALLQRSPPEKLAPPDMATFALVLLACDVQQGVAEAWESEADRVRSGRLPVCVKKGLTYSDGQIAHFELLCRDAASVIIADDVVAEAPADYLAGLYEELRRIDEFELVTVLIYSLPDGPIGQEFFDRFLRGRKPALAFPLKLMRKKARIMQHWAARIGGLMTTEEVG
jgi:hypothetical protein